MERDKEGERVTVESSELALYTVATTHALRLHTACVLREKCLTYIYSSVSFSRNTVCFLFICVSVVSVSACLFMNYRA